MRRSRFLFGILALVALLAAPAVHATSVTVQISGTWFATQRHGRRARWLGRSRRQLRGDARVRRRDGGHRPLE